MLRRLVLLMVLVAALAGCAVRRPYVPPTVDPARLTTADGSLVVEQPFDPRWWSQFDDSVLDQLIERALTANHDVRIAVARVEQARAVLDDVARDRYPTAI